MHGSLRVPTVHRTAARNRLDAIGKSSARPLPQRSPERAQTEALELRVDTEIGGGVVARLDDDRIGCANDQQRAVRLNRPREVDLLPLAIR